jgi:hypothetical protein
VVEIRKHFEFVRSESCSIYWKIAASDRKFLYYAVINCLMDFAGHSNDFCSFCVLLYSLDIVSDEKPVIAARIFIILINLT